MEPSGASGEGDITIGQGSRVHFEVIITDTATASDWGANPSPPAPTLLPVIRQRDGNRTVSR